MDKLKKYFKGDTGARGFLICLGFSVGMLIICSLIMTLLAGATKNPGDIVGIFALCAILLSAVGGGVFTAKMQSDSNLLFPALTALAVVLTMLLVAIISCGGRVSGGAFMNYACYLGVFVISALFAKNQPRRRHKRR